MKMLTTIEEKLKPEHTALIIIDYQNDFCHDDGVLGKAGYNTKPLQAIEANLIRLADAARQVGTLVVWVRNAYTTKNNLYLSPVYIEQALRRFGGRSVTTPLCEPGSWGQDFYGRVQPQPDEAIVTKHRFNAFVGTDLEVILRAKSIQTVLICGVTTNICVESTARHAFFVDYYVVVPTDAVANWEKPAHDAALANINFGFGQLTTVDEVLSIWGVAR
jgi:ureidoacrylate peracid hydrolase